METTLQKTALEYYISVELKLAADSQIIIKICQSAAINIIKGAVSYY